MWCPTPARSTTTRAGADLAAAGQHLPGRRPPPPRATCRWSSRRSGYSGGAFTYQTKSATVYDSYGRPVSQLRRQRRTKTTTSYTMTTGVTTAQTVTNPLGQATTTTARPAARPAGHRHRRQRHRHHPAVRRAWAADRRVGATAGATSSAGQPHLLLRGVRHRPVGGDHAEAQRRVRVPHLDHACTTRCCGSGRPRPPPRRAGCWSPTTSTTRRGWEWKTNTNWWDSGATPGSTIVTVPDSQVPNQTETAFDGLGRPVLVTSYDDSAVKSTSLHRLLRRPGHHAFRPPAAPPRPRSPTRSAGPPSSTPTPRRRRSAPARASGITTVTITGGTSQATDYSYNHRG